MRMIVLFVAMAFLVCSCAWAQDFTHYYNRFSGGGQAVVDSHGAVWYQLGSQMIGFDPAADMTTVLRLPFSGDASIALGAEDAVWVYYSNIWRIRDGQMQVFMLPTGTGKALATSPDGTVWVGKLKTQTQEYVLLRYENGAWEEVDNYPSSRTPRGMCFELDGTGWFGLKEGLAKYDQGEWTVFDYDLSDLSDMIVSSQGEVWVSQGWRQHIQVFEDGEFIREYKMSDGLAGAYPGPMAEDTAGNIWVVDSPISRGAGVSMFDGESWHAYNTLNSGLPSNVVSDVAASPDGAVYFTTACGLARHKNGLWNTFSGGDNCIVNNDVWSVAVNALGRAFYGTCYDQIGYYDGASWSQLNNPAGGLSTICDICFGADESVWIASNNDLRVWHGSMISYRRAGTGGINLDNTKAVCLDDRGRIWACSGGDYGGVACYDSGSWMSWAVGDLEPEPRCIACDGDGRIWVGTEKGIAVFQDETLVDWYPEYGYTSAIACDQDGFLWIGFDRSRMGLLQFDGENELAWYSMDDGLPSNWIKCLECDAGNNIWVGTGDGLAKFDRTEWTMWDIDNGIPVNEIRDISTAPNGDIWFATPAGLLCLES
ncbi:hypothetical protein J7M28_06705, partial [bacterium]|nr:hypothetical protein [bacterium]